MYNITAIFRPARFVHYKYDLDCSIRTIFLSPNFRKFHSGRAGEVNVLVQAFARNISGIVMQQIFIHKVRIQRWNIQFGNSYTKQTNIVKLFRESLEFYILYSISQPLANYTK